MMGKIYNPNLDLNQPDQVYCIVKRVLQQARVQFMFASREVLSPYC